MRDEEEIQDKIQIIESRLRYGSYKQDYIEIELLEWVLGKRDEMPEKRFDRE